MPMSAQEFRQSGLLDTIASVFNKEKPAMGLLETIGFPRHLIPNFVAASNPQEFWSEVAIEIVNGRIAGGLEALLAAAAHEYKSHPDFAPYRAAGDSIIRLLIEVRSQRFEVEELPPSRIGEIRDRALVLSKEITDGSPRRARVLHVRDAGYLVPLRLEASLAQVGLRDGDVLRLSLMADEEGSPEDICPFLARALVDFYTARVRQLRADARRSGVDRSAVFGTNGHTVVHAVVQAVAGLRALPDLTLLAAVRDLTETGLRTALGRLVWYGSPAEVAPEGYRYLRRGHRQALDDVWPTL